MINKNLIFLKILVIVGALNWGFVIFKYNLIELLEKNINLVYKFNFDIKVFLYFLIFTSAIIIALDRTTWLPFLEHTVIPSKLIPLSDDSKSYDIEVGITTKPNSKIIYWNALPENDNQHVNKAYKNMSLGVVMSDDKGNAKLCINEGEGYYVNNYKYIKKHIHYRVFEGDNILGPIKTIYY